MPRSEAFSQATVSLPDKWKAITASGVVLSSMPSVEQRKKYHAESWQKVAWQYYDIIGEFRYAAGWVGNLLSKAVLQPTLDGVVSDDPKCVAMANHLFGGPRNHGEMLRQLGIHFTVAGEAYVFAIPAGQDRDEWFVAASSETSSDDKQEKWRVADEEFDNPYAIRLWRRHPRLRRYPDAPARAVLPVLAELNGLGEHLMAQIESRLAGAGLILLPLEVDFGAVPNAVDTDGNAVTGLTSAGAFMKMLQEAMSAAIADRSSASAMVPIAVQVPGEYIDKIKHLTFWSPLDEHSIELRDEAIKRTALGMDMPPEVLEGSADLNHWSSWQVEEAAIKAHTEPLLAVILDAIVESYVRSYLIADGITDEAQIARYGFTADTSKMRLRPNRSKEAQELHDIGILSRAAVVRENGFDPEDVMDDNEFKQWALRNIARGSNTPQIVLAAIDALGIPIAQLREVDAPVRETITENVNKEGQPIQDAPKGGTNEAQPAPSLADHPVRKEPDTLNKSAASVDPALLAGSTAMVFRALERVGNRMRGRMGAKVANVAAADTYMHADIPKTTTDDWIDSNEWGALEMFAPIWGVKAEWLASILDDYTRDLIENRKPIDQDALASALTREAVLVP
jgi:hypothetical protein